MTRRVTALAALIGLCGAVGVVGFRWFARVPPPENQIEEVVRRAWTVGKRVPLAGDQEIRIPRQDLMTAHVETSSSGSLRIEYTAGALKGLTVWEDADRTYRLNPASGRLTVAPHPSEGEDAFRLIANCRFRWKGRDTVAGRATWVVEVRPESGVGSWRRLWIDPKTYVILANEARNDLGELTHGVRFRSVTYLEPGREPGPEHYLPPSHLRAEPKPTDEFSERPLTNPLRAAERLGFSIRRPRWLPQGYAFNHAFEIRCPCPVRHPAARLEFTDGMNTLSILECGHPACKSVNNCFSDASPGQLAVRAEREGYRYLLLGELPRPAAERVVSSME